MNNIPKDPPLTRRIFKYTYRLKNGSWIIIERVDIARCVIMSAHCRRLEIPFRASPMSEENDFLGTLLASYLTCSLYP